MLCARRGRWRLVGFLLVWNDDDDEERRRCREGGGGNISIGWWRCVKLGDGELRSRGSGKIQAPKMVGQRHAHLSTSHEQ